MRSFLNVDSTVTTHRLMEVRKNYFVPPEYELNTLLLGERPYNAFLSGFSLSIDALEAGLRFPLHPYDLGVPREVANLYFPDGAQLVMLSGGFPVGMLWVKHSGNSRFVHVLFPPKSGTGHVLLVRSYWVPSGRGKDMNEAWLAEAGLSPTPQDKYFATIMTRLKAFKGEDPGTKVVSHLRVEPGVDRGSVVREALHPILAKQVDVLSLTEAATLLEAELKVKGPKAVAAYKASRGFESGLKKMRRVSYEFGYRVALERLRGKHLEITSSRTRSPSVRMMPTWRWISTSPLTIAPPRRSS
ncbi:hypothetical protein BHE74_00009336 [Ensete ventricosum]|nr:hypothetical protein BHE74_00009336 [Ensete ventricosum]